MRNSYTYLSFTLSWWDEKHVGAEKKYSRDKSGIYITGG